MSSSIKIRPGTRLKCFIPGYEFNQPATRTQIAQLKQLTSVKNFKVTKGEAHVLLSQCFDGKILSVSGVMAARSQLLRNN